MSLLWRDHISIALESDQVTLVRFARGLRSRVIAKHCEPSGIQSGEMPWMAALDKLSGVLARAEWRDADATVVLSNHFVRYICMPWSENIDEEAEWLALARYHFSTVYGEVAQGWEVRLGPMCPSAPRLASGIDAGLLEGLRQLLKEKRLNLVSIQPFLMAGFNLWASRIKQNPAWFVSVEHGKLCLALLKDGHWHQVQSFLADTAETGALKLWLERTSLAGDLAANPCREVYLFAPAWSNEQVFVPHYQIHRLLMPASPGFFPDSDAKFAMAMCGAR